MKRIVFIVFLLTIGSNPVVAQWFEPSTIDGIFLLEVWKNERYIADGTGFIMGIHSELDGTTYDRFVAVTNKHLLNRTDGIKEVYISVPADTSFISYANKYNIDSFTLDGERDWMIHGSRLRTTFITEIDGRKQYAVHPDSSLDIASFALEVPLTTFFKASKDSIKTSRLQFIPEDLVGMRSDIQLGTETYFVGFPGKLGSTDPISPILRSASVAWINPTGEDYWLDATSLPGNSGSPVFTKRVLNLNGHFEPPKLVGMVYGTFLEQGRFIVMDNEDSIKAKLIEFESWNLATTVWIDDVMKVVNIALQMDEGFYQQQ